MGKFYSLEEDLQHEMAATNMATTKTNQRVKDKAMEDCSLNKILVGSNATTTPRRVISREIARRC